MKVETQDKILKSDKLIVIIAKCKSPDIRYSGDPNWPGQIFVLVIWTIGLYNFIGVGNESEAKTKCKKLQTGVHRRYAP